MTEDSIQRALQGDEAALRMLYETHRPRVLRLAYSLIGDSDEAEDVMQEVMIYALKNLDRYDPARSAFTTWLHTITVSRARDQQRRRRSALQRLGDWWGNHGSPDSGDPDAEVVLDRLDAESRVGRALQQLTPLQREALVLREVEELSFAEIGQILSVPLRTAQARVTGAYAALRKQLQPAAPTTLEVTHEQPHR